MRLEEALPLLRLGKRLRREVWFPQIFLQITNNKLECVGSFDEDNPLTLYIGDVIATDWELYEE